MRIEKIEKIIDRSKEVFKRVSLENGAIVAADSSSPIYPKGSPNYFYVWPADAAHICIASDILGLHDIPEKFFNWLLTRAEKIEDGWVFQRYDPNGMANGFLIFEIYSEEGLKTISKYQHEVTMWGRGGKRGGFRVQIQIDNYGYIVWAFYKHKKFCKTNECRTTTKKVINSILDRLAKLWGADSFKILYHDRWEEKIGYPGVNITHSLLLSYLGFKLGMEMVGEKNKWKKTFLSIKDTLKKAYVESENKWKAVFGNRYEKKNYLSLYTELMRGDSFDPEIDSLLFSLVYPVDFVKKDERIEKFIDWLVEKIKIHKNHLGLGRYPGDTYNGIFIDGSSRYPGSKGNAWPIVNFWASIVYSRLENYQKAEKYFDWVISKVKEYIPEQITLDGKFRGPIPLAWSHAMFIIAAKELGYI